jgi:SAM-dependent methyltransferase
MSTVQTVTSFYASEGIRARLEKSLEESGLAQAPIEWSKLAMADQFHAGGLEATRAVGAALAPEKGGRVLDVGSGFGGAARFLAATYGCHVAGVDLTPDYVEIASYLSDRTGLAEANSFQIGSALELPHADAQFDGALTQHVGMNIADKQRFYDEVYRVLKPGAKFAVFDVVATSDEPLSYPMPWAARAEDSFIVQPDAIQAALIKAGFVGVVSEDKTGMALEGFAQMARVMQSPGPQSSLNLAALLGGGSRQAFQNLGASLAEGKTRAQLFVAQKPEVADVS